MNKVAAGNNNNNNNNNSDPGNSNAPSNGSSNTTSGTTPGNPNAGNDPLKGIQPKNIGNKQRGQTCLENLIEIKSILYQVNYMN
jgi:hypothetical protein